MARNTKEKAQETRERIIDAATDVFYEKGVSNTSLNDVAQVAGVTRGAIYWHFKNKADLFEAMCHRVRTPIHALVEEVSSEKTADPLGQLLIMGSAFRQSVVENPNFRKVMTIIYHRYEAPSADDAILLYQRDWFIHTRESTKRILTNALAKNQLPPDLDLRLAALMLQTTFSGLMSNWLLMPDSFDLVDDANVILLAALETMRTNPALKKKT